jgi:hypothetical protein
MYLDLDFDGQKSIITFRKLQKNHIRAIQGDFEMRVQILTTSYWFHVELEKNI